MQSHKGMDILYGGIIKHIRGIESRVPTPVCFRSFRRNSVLSVILSSVLRELLYAVVASAAQAVVLGESTANPFCHHMRALGRSTEFVD